MQSELPAGGRLRLARLLRPAGIGITPRWSHAGETIRRVPGDDRYAVLQLVFPRAKVLQYEGLQVINVVEVNVLQLLHIGCDVARNRNVY